MPPFGEAEGDREIGGQGGRVHSSTVAVEAAGHVHGDNEGVTGRRGESRCRGGQKRFGFYLAAAAGDLPADHAKNFFE